jgi:hypothetical protein
MAYYYDLPFARNVYQPQGTQGIHGATGLTGPQCPQGPTGQNGMNILIKTSSIVVPANQIFVAYSNTSLPSFYTAGQSVPANLNGYLISVQ